MKFFKRLPVLSAVLGVGLAGLFYTLLPASADFNFDEMQQLEQAEQADLLAEAKKAAKAWSFSTAEDYLKQAEQKGHHAPDKLKAVRSLIKQQRQAKADKKRHEREIAERKRREEEARRQAALARERRDASGNMGGELPCSRVGEDVALYQYCKWSDCAGFGGDYGLYQLCKYDNPDGLSEKFAIWRYLKEGNVAGLGKDLQTYRAAKKYSGSFADRKRWVIFYLRGYLYGHM